MYTVVGCPECRALWIVSDRPDRTACPRCGTSHRFDQLRTLHRAEKQRSARQARSALLADRADERGEQSALAGDAIDLDAVGVNEDEYLAAAGLDPSAIGAAGETTEGTAPTPREVVLTIVEELEDPTRKTILTRADERGIERERARRVLDGLVREGAVVTSADGYRRV